MSEYNIYVEAVIYARAKHFGQYRRFTGEAYIVHPIRVARTLKAFGFGDPVSRAKAVLHDTVEDTDATLEEVTELFGGDIAKSVFHLTDPQEVSPVEPLSKQEKLERYGRNIRRGTSMDANIKLADILDNVPSMCLFAKHEKALSYVREKKFFMKYLNKGDRVLYNYVYKMLIEQEALLIDA